MIIPGSFTIKVIVCKYVDKVWAIKGEFIVTWDNNSSKQLHGWTSVTEKKVGSISMT